MRRLGTRPRHAFARALLRDTRWDAAEAGPVPILGEPAPFATAAELVALRLRRAAASAAARWAGASVGGGLAGVLAGAVGGLMLAAAPSSTASFDLAPVLAVIGGCCGAAGGAGVGAGLSVAESIARSRRRLALVCGAALGGGVAGFDRAVARAMEPRDTGRRERRHGRRAGGTRHRRSCGARLQPEHAGVPKEDSPRLAAASGCGQSVLTAGACGLAALALTLAGRPLVGGTIHAIAQASRGSQAALTPIARLVGEPDFGPLTAAVIGTGEGALFGIGLSLGARPRRALKLTRATSQLEASRRESRIHQHLTESLTCR